MAGLGFLLKLPYLFSGAPAIVRQHDGVLYKNFLSFLDPFASVFTFTYPFLAFSLLFLQAFLLTKFINNQRLMNRANFLPGMAFMIISSFLPEFNRFSAPLVTSVLLFYIFSQMFKAHSQKFSKEHIYNSGLLIGLATMFFFPAIFFIAWAVIALLTLRPFKLNEVLLLFIGLITPYYFYGIFLFLTDNWSFTNLYSGIVLKMPKLQHSIWFAGAFFLLLVPLFAGAYYAQRHSGRMLIHIRKGWALFSLYIVVGLLISFFNQGTTLENLIFIMLPIAAFHGYAYLNVDWKLFARICFWLSVAFIIAYQVVV